MKTNRMAAIVALVLALAAATAWTWKLHAFPQAGIDDANIFFSYAENLASGNGVTYARNGEPVEGFTSMLWMLMCAALFVFGLNEAGVLALSFMVLVVTQLLFLRAIRNAGPPTEGSARFPQLVYTALILCSPSYITWMTITLMDTCLWGLIVAVMTFFLVSPPRSTLTTLIAVVTFMMAPVARPEALLVVPVFIGLLWLRCRATGGEYATRMGLFFAVSFVAASVALTVFRIHYFGYPFPNTYYAKVSPSLAYNLQEGKNYLHRFILSGTVVGVFCLVLLCRAASWIGRLLDRVRHASFRSLFEPPISAGTAVSFGALTLLAVPVLTGGDHFNMFRFCQPALPLIYLAAILSATELSACSTTGHLFAPRWWRTNSLRGVTVGVVMAYWLFAFSSEFSWRSMRWGSPIEHEFRIAEDGMATGRRLNRLFLAAKRLPSVGVVTAGGIARTYAGQIVDLMGLNNSLIAHFRGDRKGFKSHAAFEIGAFFHVEPDILLASPPIPPATNNCYSVGFKGLFDDPQFTGRWRYGILSQTKDAEYSQCAFVKSAFLEEMPADSGVEFRDTMIWSNQWIEVPVLRGRRN